MNAVDMLKQDHRKISKLFAHFDRMPADDHDARGKTVKEIIQALREHAAIEEESFYPRVEEQAKANHTPEVAEEACESAEEHEEINALLNDLDGLSAKDDAFGAKVALLKKTMRSHFREEEQDLLSVIEKNMDDDDLESLGSELEKDREDVRAGKTLKHGQKTVH
jgi:hemerythrin superfamily protein